LNFPRLRDWDRPIPVFRVDEDVNGFSGADGGTRELLQDLVAGKMTANEVAGNRLVFRNRREESNLLGDRKTKKY
jgi:hypothetical protein